tara:strand:- start:7833 stop:8723 length:891 start_codon:yes stop_codon:yes gene_type:complete
MTRLLLFLCILFNSLNSYNQEIRCEVLVNSDLVNQTNQQIFITLQKSIQEFMNSQVWTSQNWNVEERINCSIIINLTSYSGNNFKGTLQVQSQRPIYESNYNSPILNFQDLDLNFSYEEFQPLFYNTNRFDSNLISILSFYAYLIIGLDSDSFKPQGGQTFYVQAQKISNLAQQTKNSGWISSGNRKNRYWLIDSILSKTFEEFRTTNYQYHRMGLDMMTTDQFEAKTNIANSLLNFNELNKRRPNSFLIQLFFDAKSQEIVNIFSEGVEIDLDATKQTLKRVAPFFNNKWKEIKG